MTKSRAISSESSSPPPFGVLERIEAFREKYSKSERRVVDYLLVNPHEFARSNVKDVASASSVSEPTVVRFCRRVGCEGFKDLKLQLVEDLAYHQALSEGGLSDSKLLSISAERKQLVGRTVFQAAAKALQHSVERLDWVVMEKAADAITASRRVVIFGVGGSSSALAQELHNRLFRLDINCCPFVDGYLQRMASVTLSGNDVAFFVSSTGRPRGLLDDVELAQHYGATCIGIAPTNSSLGHALDLCIDLELTQGGVEPSHPNPMRYGQLFLIDCLAYAVALKIGPHADTVLKRVRASVSSLHGIAPLQPIGD